MSQFKSSESQQYSELNMDKSDSPQVTQSSSPTPEQQQKSKASQLADLSEAEKNQKAIDFIFQYKHGQNTKQLDNLLKSGVSPNLALEDGKTLLMLAAGKGHIELVRILANHGADINLKDRSNRTALFHAIEQNSERVKVVEILLEHGANANQELQDKSTPLIKAVERNFYMTSQLILNRSGNAGAKLDNGDTALHIAVRNQQINMIQLLFEHGCNPKLKNNKKQTPLDLCKDNEQLYLQVKKLYDDQEVLNQQRIKESINRPNPATNSQHSQQNQHNEMGGFTDVENYLNTGAGQQNPNENNGTNMQQQLQQNNYSISPDDPASGPSQTKPNKKYASNSGNVSPSIHPNRNKRPSPNKAADFMNQGGINPKYNPNVEGRSPKVKTQNPLQINSSAKSMDDSIQMGPDGNFMRQQQIIEYSNDNEDSIQAGNDSQSPLNENEQQPIHIQPRANNNISLNMNTSGNRKRNSQSGPSNDDQFHSPGKSPGMQQIQQMSKNAQIGTQNIANQNMGGGTGGGYTNMKNNNGNFNQQNQPYSPNFGNNNNPNNGNNTPNYHNNSNNNYSNPQNQNIYPSYPGNYYGPNQFNNQNFKKKNKNMKDSKGYPMGNPNGPGMMGPGNMQGNNNMGGNQQPYTPTHNGPQDRQSGNQHFRTNFNFTQGEIYANQQNSGSGGINPNNSSNPSGSTQGPNNNNNNGNNNNASNLTTPTRSISDQPSGGGYGQNNNNNNPQKGFKNSNKRENPMDPNSQNMMNGPYQGDQQTQQGGQQGQSYDMMMRIDPIDLNGMAQQIIQTQKDDTGVQGNMRVMMNKNYQGSGNQNYGGNRVNSNSSNNNNQGGYNQFQNQYMGFGHHWNQNFLGGPFMGQNKFDGPMQNSRGGEAQQKILHINLSDPGAQENIKLSAEKLTLLNMNEKKNQEIQLLKQELDAKGKQIESLQQKLKSLEEKDQQIDALKKKNEELEKALKQKKEVSLESSGIDQIFKQIAITGPLSLKTIFDNPRPNENNLSLEQVADSLHKEVLEFEKMIDDYNTTHEKEFDKLIELIRESVNEAFPGAECDIYGSYATTLCLPQSDIDIVVRLPDQYENKQAYLKIEQNIRNKKWQQSVQAIKTSSVPVLKITCSKEFYYKKVDITFQDFKHNGLHCVSLVKEFLKCYPPLRPLVLVLKQFLYSMSLNEAYKGGLSSYGLILMIVFMFQQKEPRAVNPIEHQNLGHLLMMFLNIYGFEFDYVNCYVINPREIVQNNGQVDYHQQDYALMQMMQNAQGVPRIIIQDPLQMHNNVARSTFQIHEIKQSFMAAYYEAFKPCEYEVHKAILQKEFGESSLVLQDHKSSIFRRMLQSYHLKK